MTASLAKWPGVLLALLAVAAQDAARPKVAFQSVSAGASHTCGIATGGLAYCWGDNTAGELGTGDGRSHRRPAAVTGHLAFVSLSAGDGFTCGITDAGLAYCWGRNTYRQLGSFAPLRTEVPTPVVAGGIAFVQISAGHGHACAVSTQRVAYCWGGNDDGDLGTGDTAHSQQARPVVGGVSFLAVSAGWSHTCGVTPGGTAYCWGANGAGQLGNGTRTSSRIPVAVVHVTDFIFVSAGARHTCGLTAPGAVYCWGDDFTHQLGGGNGVGSLVPVEGGPPPRRVAAVTAGGFHTCTLTRETIYRVTCWGLNQESQLGVPDTLPSATVTSRTVFGGIPFVQLDAGDAHTCGTTDDGAVYCWGRNDDGELGDGTTHPPLRPVRVIEPDSTSD